jgi:hypothetical protein
MKKTMMQLAVTGMVLACSQAVFAQTYVLWVFDGIPPTNIKTVENGIHKNGHGYVTFQANHDEGGVVVSVDVTVVLQQAAKSYTYSVQHGPGQFRSPLTTDKKGNGVVTFTVLPPFATSMGKNIIIHANAATAGGDIPLWYAYNPFGPW